jgi:leucyl aminopeptidase
LVRIGVKKATPEEVGADLLAVGIHSGEGPPQGLSSAAQPAVSNEDFTGKRGQTSLFYAGDALTARRLLLVGLGDRSSFTPERLRRTAATVARRARSLKARDVAFVLPTPEGSGIRGTARVAAEGAVLGL